MFWKSHYNGYNRILRVMQDTCFQLTYQTNQEGGNKLDSEKIIIVVITRALDMIIKKEVPYKLILQVLHRKWFQWEMVFSRNSLWLYPVDVPIWKLQVDRVQPLVKMALWDRYRIPCGKFWNKLSTLVRITIKYLWYLRGTHKQLRTYFQLEHFVNNLWYVSNSLVW